MPLVAVADLIDRATTLLRASGAPEDIARITAEVIVGDTPSTRMLARLGSTAEKSSCALFDAASRIVSVPPSAIVVVANAMPSVSRSPSTIV